jgi:hypothetical protein
MRDGDKDRKPWKLNKKKPSGTFSMLCAPGAGHRYWGTVLLARTTGESAWEARGSHLGHSLNPGGVVPPISSPKDWLYRLPG